MVSEPIEALSRDFDPVSTPNSENLEKERKAYDYFFHHGMNPASAGSPTAKELFESNPLPLALQGEVRS